MTPKLLDFDYKQHACYWLSLRFLICKIRVLSALCLKLLLLDFKQLFLMAFKIWLIQFWPDCHKPSASDSKEILLILLISSYQSFYSFCPYRAQAIYWQLSFVSRYWQLIGCAVTALRCLLSLRSCQPAASTRWRCLLLRQNYFPLSS